MNGSIRLDPKHGLNPSLMLCFFCQEPSGVALLGASGGKVSKALGMPHDDGQAPRQATYDMVPCAKCKELMGQGVILISVDESKSEDRSNPYRTGVWCVVKDDFLKRTMNEQAKELLEQILRLRVAFLPDDAWDKLGLPRGPVEG
jgi:hypothetical protein